MQILTAKEGFISIPFPFDRPLYDYAPKGFRIPSQIPTSVFDTARQGYLRIPVTPTPHRFLPSIQGPLGIIAFTITTVLFPVTVLLASHRDD